MATAAYPTYRPAASPYQNQGQTYGGGLSSPTGSTGNQTYTPNTNTAWNTDKSGQSAWGSGSAFGGTTSGSTYSGSNMNYAGQPMTTQPTSPSSGSGSSAYDWYNNWTGTQNGPTYPASTTGAQTSTNLPGSQATTGGSAGTSSGGFTWDVPPWIRGLTAQQWGDPAMGQAAQNYTAISLPFSQLQQNAYQYGMDFNENQRRWDNQFGWQQNTDTFNMNLAQQQQQMADWVARQQQNNWQQQYGLDSQVALGNLDISRQQQQSQDWYQRNQIGVAQEQNRIDQMYKAGQLTNDQYANETQRIQAQNQLHLGNAQNQIAQYNADTERQQIANQLHLGNVQNQISQFNADTARQQNAIDQMYKAGMLSNEQYANESQRIYQTGQLALGNREAGQQEWYQQQQVGLAQQQNQIDQMYKMGLLSQQQAELALAQLTQQQNDAYRYSALSQEGALARENMTNQQKLTAMNAFGRWQAPSTRFIRAW